MRSDAPAWASRVEPWICIAIAGLTLLVYFQVHGFSFLTFDDPLYVSRNAYVQSGWTLKGLRWAFTTGEAGNWHPLVWLSYMTDVAVFGVNPGAHHLVNEVLHLANSLLCFAVLRAMTGEVWPSAVVAVLFAIHPLHVESVAWISERKDVLSTFFWFLTLGAYTRYARRPSRFRYASMTLLFILGLMSKAMLVTLPLTLLMLDYWPLGRITLAGMNPKALWCSIAPRLPEKLPLFGVSLAMSAVALFSQQSQGATATLTNLPFAWRLGNGMVSAVHYLSGTVWPVHLAVFYPHPGLSLPHWQIVGAGGLLGLMTAGVAVFGRQHRFLVTGWLWFLVTLLPVIGIIQVGSQARADRYTYIPLIGIFIVVAWAGKALADHFRLPGWTLGIGTGSVVAVLTLLSARQVSYWKDNVTLFEHALRVTSDNGLSREHLGHGYLAQGKYPEAAIEYTRGLAFKPGSLEIYFGLGDALDHMGRPEDAIASYQRVLALSPGYVFANYQIANILVRSGRFTDAIPHFYRVLNAKPRDIDPDEHVGRAIAVSSGVKLGIILRTAQRLEEARDCFQSVLRLDPQSQLACLYLGLSLSDLGREEEAISILQRGVSIDPSKPAVQYALGVALLQRGRIDEASRAFDTVLKLVPGNAEALQQLKSIELLRAAQKAP